MDSAIEAFCELRNFVVATDDPVSFRNVADFQEILVREDAMPGFKERIVDRTG
jgi:hypothetical protein